MINSNKAKQKKTCRAYLQVFKAGYLFESGQQRSGAILSTLNTPLINGEGLRSVSLQNRRHILARPHLVSVPYLGHSGVAGRRLRVVCGRFFVRWDNAARSAAGREAAP